MSKKTQAACRRPDIGGQAVMEGVMMKAPDAIAISVRRPNGDIVTKRKAYVPLSAKHKWMGWPIVRGVVNFVTMLSMGMSTLQDSTDMLGIMDEEPTKFEKWLAKKLGKGIDKIVMGTAIVLAVILSVGLFFVIPELVARGLKALMPDPAMNWLINLLSGIVRICILIAYILFCSTVPDVRRTFEYHGAEHKTVYCNENDLPLTPENAQQFTTLHPRCGTSFLLIVMVISILVFSVASSGLLAAVPALEAMRGTFLFRLLMICFKLLLLPVVVGITYEINRLVGRYDNWFTAALSAPGLWMQNFTTNEPDDSMIEVGIAAVQAVLPEEEGADRW